LKTPYPDCKIVKIDTYLQDATTKDGLIEFDGKLNTTEQYYQEKSRGGKNSYQAYKPLRDKVEELCKSNLSKKQYQSANRLCNEVAQTIEEMHPELLNDFQPYQNYEYEGNDWKRPTLYNWCNKIYKAFIYQGIQ
jgi:hypothetical protein